MTLAVLIFFFLQPNQHNQDQQQQQLQEEEQRIVILEDLQEEERKGQHKDLRVDRQRLPEQKVCSFLTVAEKDILFPFCNNTCKTRAKDAHASFCFSVTFPPVSACFLKRKKRRAKEAQKYRTFSELQRRRCCIITKA